MILRKVKNKISRIKNQIMPKPDRALEFEDKCRILFTGFTQAIDYFRKGNADFDDYQIQDIMKIISEEEDPQKALQEFVLEQHKYNKQVTETLWGLPLYDNQELVSTFTYFEFVTYQQTKAAMIDAWSTTCLEHTQQMAVNVKQYLDMKDEPYN